MFFLSINPSLQQCMQKWLLRICQWTVIPKLQVNTAGFFIQMYQQKYAADRPNQISKPLIQSVAIKLKILDDFLLLTQL